jgi:hypothetical protein
MKRGRANIGTRSTGEPRRHSACCAQRLLVLVIASLVSGSVPTPCQAAGATRPHLTTFMHMDYETRVKWRQAHAAMPKAPMAQAVPAPNGALSFLQNLNYSPAERYQGACGNCWCWAGHGCMEILLSLQTGYTARLSVQYMNSCETAAIGKTCCTGGHLSDVAAFYSKEGYRQAIPWSNPGANWQDVDGTCDTPCGSITTVPRFPVQSITAYDIATYRAGQAQAIANIKLILNQRKPVGFVFWLPTIEDWSVFTDFWNYQSEADSFSMDYSAGHTWNTGLGHEVLCIGYNDDNPANPYWILVNSWGTTDLRPNGIFHMRMDINYNCSFKDVGTYQTYYWNFLDVVYNTPPPFAAINASMSSAKQGTAVAITFQSWAALATNPAVTVNHYPATYVTNSATNYTYFYTIRPADTNGPAAMLISGVDFGGTIGSITNKTALSIDNIAPTITLGPSNQVAVLGANALFQVTAVGTLPLAYQWRRNGTNLAGATQASLTLTNVDATRAGTYTALVTNILGAALSSEAALTVLDPGIVSHPQNQFVIAGAPAVFRVIAGGTPLLHYEWRRGPVVLENDTNISGADTDTLAIAQAQAAEEGQYSVWVSNTNGLAVSSNAALVLVAAPVISMQPTNQMVVAGSLAAFGAEVVCASPVSYQWRRAGTNLMDEGKISGSSTATLIISNAQPSDVTNYSLVVTNACYAVVSSNASLSLWPMAAWGRNDYGQADLLAGLTNVSAIAAGAFHNLALRTDGTVAAWGAGLTNSGANPHYGQAIVPAGLTNAVAVAAKSFHSLAVRATGTVAAWGAGATNTGVNPHYGQAVVPVGLSNVVAVAAGGYHNLALKADGTVAAWGAGTTNTGSNPNYGQAAVPANLSNVVAITAGTYHSLALKSDGTVVGWGYNNYGQTNVPPGLSNVVAMSTGGYHNLALRADGTVMAWGNNTGGQTNVPNTLTNAVAVAAGAFHSLALRSDGTISGWGVTSYNESVVPGWVSNNVQITAGNSHNVVRQSDGRPLITLQPLSQTVLPGATVRLVALAVGQPALSWQWQRNGTNLEGATLNSLTLTNFTCSAAGAYTLLVSNQTGSATSRPALLPLLDSLPPTIHFPTNLAEVADAGQCSKSNVVWELTANDDCGLISLVSEPPSGSTLPIGVTTVRCTAVDVAGNTNSGTFTVTVTASPLALTGPANQTVLVGQPAVFSVSALNDCGRPLTYQWRFNGADLPGATTNGYSLECVRLTNGGSYDVVVAHLSAAVTSETAVLTVVGPALTLFPPEPIPGGSGVMQFTFTYPTVTGIDYIVEAKDALADVDWLPLVTNPGMGGPLTNIFPILADRPCRFYRIVTP